MLAQILKKYSQTFPVGVIRFLGNLYVPFLGAGIKIENIAKDYHYIRVSMPLKWFNKNYVGTHFGGSIFAMVDPWYMMMLINILGKDFLVWDKGADIQFIKPGTTKIIAEFQINEKEIKNIKQEIEKEGRYLFKKEIVILDTNQNIVSKVRKSISIKKKPLTRT